MSFTSEISWQQKNPQCNDFNIEDGKEMDRVMIISIDSTEKWIIIRFKLVPFVLKE